MPLSARCPLLLASLSALLAGLRLVQPPPLPTQPPPPPLFGADERARVVAYWNLPGRYQISAPPDAASQGPWQVRLTPEGSAWLLAYQRAVAGPAKLPPTQDAAAAAPPEWESWLQARLARDRYEAQVAAGNANATARGLPAPPPGPPAGVPPAPGPIPPSLLAACGNPPPFANAVTPLRYTVTFDDNQSFAYSDNVALRPRYAYYRFPQGTVAYGPMLRDLPAGELDALFAQAGLTASEQRIARAVSRLEGGFETVNTYDTGFVSVGFLQFVTLADGKASLSEVLARQKADRPTEFERDFRRFGVDVGADGVFTVVDPATGAELRGPDAVFRAVADKRFAAVFQRAGRTSAAFRVAQIRVAKARYWPADDPVTVTVKGRTVSGTVRDVVRSEAGMATLFDRKVNRGTIAPFNDVVARVMTERNLPSLVDAARFEKEIVRPLRYRADFLADKTLGQPK